MRSSESPEIESETEGDSDAARQLSADSKRNDQNH